MDILQPKSDFCFKELFENQKIRTYFVSDVLGIPLDNIRSVKLRNTFLRRKRRKLKQGILDVFIELDNRVKINIEIQLVRQADWEKRQVFYLCNMYTNDLKAGEGYSKLNRCVSISILDFNLDDRPDYHNVYHFRDKTGNKFTDVLELHTIELRKKLVGDSEINDWIRFFNVKSEEDLDMIHTKNPGILEAIQELKHMSLGKIIRARYEEHLKCERDKKAMLSYAHNSGVEEGRQEGRVEAYYNMGLSIEDIVEKTGVSEEEVKQILHNQMIESKK